MKLREVDWRSCHSMSEDIELERLEYYCEQAVERSGNELAIEIGSFHGKTTALIAQYFQQVIAIDLWGNVDWGLSHYDQIGQHHFTSFIQNMARLRLIEVVFPVVSTSKFLTTLEYMRDEEIGADLIFIDGDHHYEPVKQDIERAKEYVTPEGLMVLHDYKRPGWGYPPYDPNHPHHGPNDPWAGVAKAIDEFLVVGEWKIFDHFKGIIALERS